MKLWSYEQTEECDMHLLFTTTDFVSFTEYIVDYFKYSKLKLCGCVSAQAQNRIEEQM